MLIINITDQSKRYCAQAEEYTIGNDMCVRGWSTKAGTGKLQPAACFVNKVTVEHSLAHSIMDCMYILLYLFIVICITYMLLSLYSSIAEMLQSLK